MRKLAYVKCDNGFKRLLYLSQDKRGGMTKKQEIKLNKELLKNGKYEALHITYLDSMSVDQIDEMIYAKSKEKK